MPERPRTRRIDTFHNITKRIDTHSSMSAVTKIGSVITISTPSLPHDPPSNNPGYPPGKEALRFLGLGCTVALNLMKRGEIQEAK